MSKKKPPTYEYHPFLPFVRYRKSNQRKIATEIELDGRWEPLSDVSARLGFGKTTLYRRMESIRRAGVTREQLLANVMPSVTATDRVAANLLNGGREVSPCDGLRIVRRHGNPAYLLRIGGEWMSTGEVQARTGMKKGVLAARLRHALRCGRSIEPILADVSARPVQIGPVDDAWKAALCARWSRAGAPTIQQLLAA